MDAKEAENEDKLPPGFRFHPTDEELITHYLLKKIADTSFTGTAIADADLNKCEPWDLPGKAKMGEKEWYFFSLRDRKYPTGVRTNRATNAGYWKTTGKDKEIFSGSNSRMSSSHLLGMKKTLVFYRGRAPRGEKSNWVMHEYRVHSRSSLRTPKDEWVVCRVFQKNDFGKKYSTQTSRESQYNLEVNTNLLSHPTTKTVNCDGSYITITDFTGLTSNGGMRNEDSTQNVNFSLFSPSKNFTISGLNLNLGRGVTVPLLQNYYSPVQQPSGVPVHQGDAIFAAEAVTYAEQQDGGDGRSMTEQCLDLDAYWPTY